MKERTQKSRIDGTCPCLRPHALSGRHIQRTLSTRDEKTTMKSCGRTLASHAIFYFLRCPKPQSRQARQARHSRQSLNPSFPSFPTLPQNSRLHETGLPANEVRPTERLNRAESYPWSGSTSANVIGQSAAA